MCLVLLGELIKGEAMHLQGCRKYISRWISHEIKSFSVAKLEHPHRVLMWALSRLEETRPHRDGDAASISSRRDGTSRRVSRAEEAGLETARHAPWQRSVLRFVRDAHSPAREWASLISV